MMTFPSLLSHHHRTMPQPGPAVQEGVPGDDNDVRVAGLASEESSVESAGHKGPQGSAEGGIVLEDPANKDRRGGHCRWKRDDSSVVGVVLGTNDGGEKGHPKGRMYGRQVE